MIKHNYHTHTTRCKHAKDEDELYVLKAIEAGYKTLGFSDHIPFKYCDSPSPIRMDIDQVEEYVQSINELKEKYKDKITIYVGFESEYIENEIPFYKDLLDSKKVDYLIQGNHIIEGYDGYVHFLKSSADLNKYVDSAIRGMKSGLFKYLAHPDLFMINLTDFDDNCIQASMDICKAALDLDIPLEYNCEGLRDTLNGHVFRNGTTLAYPHPEFWKIVAKMKNKVILGADAHRADSLNDDAMKEALKRVEALGLNVIDNIEI